MPSLRPSAAILTLLLVAVASPALAQAPAPDAAAIARGKALYIKDGCYQCHGVQGQGAGIYGPKIAPGVIPRAAFFAQIRRPRDAMPVYTAFVMPDDQVSDIFAYVQSIRAKPLAEIPLLNR
jgi:ubiquinol-cytochrome c reductase cytochrome c subunit